MPDLTSMVSGYVTMKPNTALALLFGGVALWLLAPARAVTERGLSRTIGLLAAAVCAAIGVVTLVEMAFGLGGVFDGMLVRARVDPANAHTTVRMAATSAATFVLLGAGLFTLVARTPAWERISEWLLAGSLSVPLGVLVGYLYHVIPTQGQGQGIQMAMHTAVGIAALAIGAFAARPEREFVSALRSRGPGAALARRLLPAAVAIPVALSALRLLAERIGTLTAASGAAAATVATILLLAGLIWRTTAELDRVEARRMSALEMHLVRERELSSELRRAAALYRSIFEGAREGLFIVERAIDGTFTYRAANSAISRMTGIDAEAFVDRRPDELLPANTAASVTALFAQALETGEPVEVERVVILPTATITARTRLFPVEAEDGRLVRLLGISEDVTEQVAARKQLDAYARELERSNGELQAFAYVASHDLQEPLRKIRAFGDRLLTRYGPALEAQGSDYIGRMQSAAERMQALVHDLLEYSRVSAKPAVAVEVDLMQVAHEVIADLQERIDGTGARIEVGALPVISGDRLQMRQLFQNLIANGLKFHRDGIPPVIEVWSEPAEGSAVSIHIRDNGIGFDMQYAERIFTPFERLHTRRQYEGTGMGLAICRRIAERHDGSISAESTPGSGSRFLVTLETRPARAGWLDA